MMKNARAAAIAGAFVALTIGLGYFVQRDQFWQLTAGWLAFFPLIFLVKKGATTSESMRNWLIFGLFLRFLLLFSWPNLSDDFWRFIWDGRIWLAGGHPFSQPPDYFFEKNNWPPGLSPTLFEKLNSQKFYTVYPPVCQVVFAAAAFLGKNSDHAAVFFMKFFLFACEVGTVFLLKKMASPTSRTPLVRVSDPKGTVRRFLTYRNLFDFLHRSETCEQDVSGRRSSRAIANVLCQAIGHSALSIQHSPLIYALCPLPIFEVVGNCHFEGAMLFFLLAGIYFFKKNEEKLVLPALFLSLSIAAKLLPLMFLPLLLPILGFKNWLKSMGWLAFFSLIFWLPMLDFGVLKNMSASLGLYFKAFEFNASFYYLIKPLARNPEGFDRPELLGPLLAMATILTILGLTIALFLKKIIAPTAFLAASMAQLLFASTVHPWYVLTPFLLCFFTKWRFAVVWAAVAVLSYSHYLQRPWAERFEIIGLEYAAVLIFFLFEIWRCYFLKKPRLNVAQKTNTRP